MFSAQLNNEERFSEKPLLLSSSTTASLECCWRFEKWFKKSLCFIIFFIPVQSFICHLITHLCKMKSLWRSSTGSLSLSKVVGIINILVRLLNKNWLAFKQAYKCFIVSFQNESLGWVGYFSWQYSHGTSNELLWCPHILRSQINKVLATQNFWERFTNRASNSSHFVRA